ncbi:MAG: right-handed parallel beta-helix repeat-containing protein, partial [Proteobacteria bacterium]|nr:right-handed parallel beta-helix repeat-containing protein [Pseudomonadota bacterium]
MKLVLAALAATALFAGAAEARTWNIQPNAEAEQQLQAAMIGARPGDTIAIGRGRFDLTQGLSLDVDRVTVRGAGQDRTVLSFAGQRRGAEGLLVTSNGVTLRDFAVEDAKGDAIKARDCQGITFHGVRVEWTHGPDSHNGAYGLYPVNCSDVLVEQSIVRGASDAGIYVGQSRNIIVRDNIAENNVAGIEIENCFNADVFNNVARHNTGGVLVFDLPDLQQHGGHAVRVFHNRIEDNNTPNFAAAGAIVGGVPAGTGVIVMANRDVVVFDNDIGGNGTANIIVTSYWTTFADPNYNPLPRNVMIRNNRFGNTGFAPTGDIAALARAGLAL